MQRWEYQSIYVDLELDEVDEILDEYGADGWELVSAVPVLGSTKRSGTSVTLGIPLRFQTADPVRARSLMPFEGVSGSRK